MMSLELSTAEVAHCNRLTVDYIQDWEGVPDTRRHNQAVPKVLTVFQGYKAEAAFLRMFPHALRVNQVHGAKADGGVDIFLHRVPIDVKSSNQPPGTGHMIVACNLPPRAHFALLHVRGRMVHFAGFFHRGDLREDHRRTNAYWVHCSELYPFQTLREKIQCKRQSRLM